MIKILAATVFILTFLANICLFYTYLDDEKAQDPHWILDFIFTTSVIGICCILIALFIYIITGGQI